MLFDHGNALTFDLHAVFTLAESKRAIPPEHIGPNHTNELAVGLWMFLERYRERIKHQGLIRPWFGNTSRLLRRLITTRDQYIHHGLTS